MVRFFTIFVVLLFSLAAAFAADEKRVEKPLGQWIADLGSDNEQTRKAASQELGSYEHVFEVPGRDEDWDEIDRVRVEVKPHLQALQALLKSPYDDSRITAILLLAAIGQEASVANPVLLDILQSKEADEGVRQMAATALLFTTPPEQPVGPVLLKEIRSSTKRQDQEEDDPVGGAAGAGIAAVGVTLMLVTSGRTGTELPTLIELTRPEFSLGIRLTMIATLAELDAEAKPALPALRELLADEDRTVRVSAGSALLHIKGSLEEFPDIAKRLELDDKENRQLREGLLQAERQRHDMRKWLRENAAELVPQLMRQMKRNNPTLQRQAIRMLGEIGPAAKSAIPDLVAASKSDVAATREAALEALQEIDTSSSQRGGK